MTSVELTTDQWRDILIALECRISDLDGIGGSCCADMKSSLKRIKQQIEEQTD